MLSRAKDVYRTTRKRHDQLFNTYVMRPIAALLVSALARSSITPNQLTLGGVVVFAAAAALLAVYPTYWGGVAAVAVVELSYLLDCADGMLARHKKIASIQGHLFDFFTDEIKAVLLVAALSIRLWRAGGWAPDASWWPAETDGFLLAGIAAVAVIASATSLTNFVRRPELSGRETPVQAHYETVEQPTTRSTVGRVASLVVAFLRFLNHYPSHIWLFALLGRLDVLFWIYATINLLYLGRGWLGLALRFGRR